MIFENYSRSEAALVAGMAEMVVNGVSTRKVEKVVQEICGTSFSKSTVSNLCKDLYRTAAYLNPARKDYLQLYYAHRILEPQDSFNLLYVKATETDHAYAFAAGQLDLAMKCADKAKKEEKNAAKRPVSFPEVSIRTVHWP